MKYELKLANFEGPLDLLLHLISKAKIDLEDIFVSEITEQYLSYMDQTGLLDLDMSSDFLQMAATLLYIKSRSLLPEKRRGDETDEDGLTPEEVLIKKLTEYRRYKEAAERLRELETGGRAYFYKLPEEVLPDGPQEQAFTNADIQALSAAYLRLLAKVRRQEGAAPIDVVIYRDGFSVREQIRRIRARLSIAQSAMFAELLSERPTREELAVTFLAVLELVHLGKACVRQQGAFGEIAIYRRMEESA